MIKDLEKEKTDLHIDVFEAFAGYGSQSLSLEELKNKYEKIGYYLKYKVVGISEIDKSAIIAYNALHSGNVKNYGDISKIETSTLPDFDLFTYSFPCFIEGTLVLTEKGFKKIEEITCEDKVLTHTNGFQKVLKPMINKANHIYEIKNMASEDLYVTEEHPFYTRERKRINNVRKFDKPKWVKTKDLTKDNYLGVAINQKSELPIWDGVTFKWSDERKDRHSNRLSELFKSNDFWWVIGRFIGDGWIRSSGGIIICCAKNETIDITKKLNNIGFNYNIVEELSINKIHIGFKEIGEYCEQFGRGAGNKRLTGDILNLPKSLLNKFLNGYMSADGCFTQGLYKATSISRELVHGIGQCVAKVYNRPFSIYKTIREDKTIIDGRLVNQSDTYTVVWKTNTSKQDKAFFENNYLWVPINDINQLEYDGLVYNLEVENDNSYTANGIIVHNCQDISILGKRQGFEEDSGTRSSLLWECKKVIETKKPKYLLLENVKQLVGTKHIDMFKTWVDYLEGQGYTNYYHVVNSKFFGIPQNRERVFCVSVLGEHEPFEFPTKENKFLTDEERLVTLDDILELDVPKKLYNKKPFYYNKKTKPCGVCEDKVCQKLCSCGEVPELNTHPHIMSCFYNKQKTHTINSKRFKKVLNEQKDKLDFTYSDIRNLLGFKTNNRIKNWFEKPNSYPRVSEWALFKEILKIESNEFDDLAIEELEPIKFNMINNVKCHTGINNTLVCNDTIFHVQVPRRNFEEGKIYHTCRQIDPTVGDIEYCNDCIHYEQRLLSAREFWRLMGLSDEYYEKVLATGIRNRQMYNLAGNSIVLPVLVALFENMLIPQHIREEYLEYEKNLKGIELDEKN